MNSNEKRETNTKEEMRIEKLFNEIDIDEDDQRLDENGRLVIVHFVEDGIEELDFEEYTKKLAESNDVEKIIAYSNQFDLYDGSFVEHPFGIYMNYREKMFDETKFTNEQIKRLADANFGFGEDDGKTADIEYKLFRRLYEEEKKEAINGSMYYDCYKMMYPILLSMNEKTFNEFMENYECADAEDIRDDMIKIAAQMTTMTPEEMGERFTTEEIEKIIELREKRIKENSVKIDEKKETISKLKWKEKLEAQDRELSEQEKEIANLNAQIAELQPNHE